MLKHTLKIDFISLISKINKSRILKTRAKMIIMKTRIILRVTKVLRKTHKKTHKDIRMRRVKGKMQMEAKDN